MFPFGRMYECVIPTFTRSLTANEVICRISAPSDAILLVLEASFGIVGTDGLNEPNAMEILRLTTDGTGGAAVTFKTKEVGDAAAGATGAAIDANDWTAQPTSSDVVAGALPFNLAAGWNWSWTQSAPIVVSPSGRIGFRIVDAISASMICHASMTILEIGG